MTMIFSSYEDISISANYKRLIVIYESSAMSSPFLLPFIDVFQALNSTTDASIKFYSTFHTYSNPSLLSNRLPNRSLTVDLHTRTKYRHGTIPDRLFLLVEDFHPSTNEKERLSNSIHEFIKKDLLKGMKNILPPGKPTF